MWDEAPSRLKEFLRHPCESNFENIFDLVFRQTRAYLVYLRRKGYQLPIDAVSDESALDDLAIDILGSLFQSRNGIRFNVIHGYYRANGVVDYDSYKPEDLWDMFERLLRGYVHQELMRLKKSDNPQVEVLKRRFKDILKSEEYRIHQHGNTQLVHRAETAPDLNLPLISFESLHALVEEAFAHSHNRVEWCRLIFDYLEKENEYCAAVSRSDLLRAVVMVNASFMEVCYEPLQTLYGHQGVALGEAIIQARSDTLDYMKNEIISGFVRKQRVRQDDTALYLAACRRYLEDFGHDGGTDAIPEYFREVMPGEYSERYLAEFKYVFETIISRAKEDFLSRLKKNPIIRQYGDYLGITE